MIYKDVGRNHRSSPMSAYDVSFSHLCHFKLYAGGELTIHAFAVSGDEMMSDSFPIEIIDDIVLKVM